MNSQTLSGRTITERPWLIEHPPSHPTYIVKEEVTGTQETRKISHLVMNLNVPKRQCLIFTTGGTMDYVYLTPYNGNVHMLDVAQLFPNGALSVRVAFFPGTSLKLHSDWRIIASKGIPGAPYNLALKSLYHRDWAGNIVVTKYADSGIPEDIHPWDKDTAVALLKMWLENFDNIRPNVLQRPT